jgi:hypothetical protein
MTQPAPKSPALPSFLLAAIERLGWRHLTSEALQSGELRTLGFSAQSEALALQGAWLVPLAGRDQDAIRVRGHRLLGDEPSLTLALDESTSRGPRRATLGAWGALRSDADSWGQASLPLWLIEGDLLAAALVAVAPSLAVLSAPAPGGPQTLARSWLGRAQADLQRVSLRRRPVTLVRAPGSLAGASMAALAQLLEQRGAVVRSVDAPACLDAPEALAAWLESIGQASGPQASTTAAGEALTRLRDRLPETLWLGPEHLRLPPGFVLLDGPSAPLGKQIGH